MVGLAVHIKNISNSLIGIIKTSNFVIKYNNIICTMYPVSYPQDKQLQKKAKHLWAYLKHLWASVKRSSQWIFFINIKYLLPSSSISLDNYILVWPWTCQSSQMSIHPYLCITTHLLMTLISCSNPTIYYRPRYWIRKPSPIKTRMTATRKYWKWKRGQREGWNQDNRGNGGEVK